MRRLFKNTKIVELVVALACWGVPQDTLAQAQRVVAVVQSVGGNVFYSHRGQIKTLASGMRLRQGAEVFTEEGAQITFNNYYDHVYHLSGSGHIALDERALSLKSGYLWVQFVGAAPPPFAFQVGTANSKIFYRGGEAIMSFDNSLGKTQLLVLAGRLEMENAIQAHLKLEVQEGQFSFIQNGYLEGAPRMPTPIGLNSYQQVTGLFHEVRPLRKSQALFFSPSSPQTHRRRGRGLASVARARVRPEKTLLHHYRARLFQGGEAKVPIRIFGQSGQNLKTRIFHCPRQCSKERDLTSHLKWSKPPTVAPKKKTAQNRPKVLNPVKVFGKKRARQQQALTVEVPARPPRRKIGRAPASVAARAVKGKAALSAEPDFEKALDQHYSEQQRHQSEVNALIDQLQSVQMDYQKGH